MSLMYFSFLNVKKLTNLDLSFNELETIKNGVFNGLTTVAKLNLENNYIQLIEPGSFIYLTALKEEFLYIMYVKLLIYNKSIFILDITPKEYFNEF